MTQGFLEPYCHSRTAEAPACAGLYPITQNSAWPQVVSNDAQDRLVCQDDLESEEWELDSVAHVRWWLQHGSLSMQRRSYWMCQAAGVC
jgi:hypothetical protein